MERRTHDNPGFCKSGATTFLERSARADKEPLERTALWKHPLERIWSRSSGPEADGLGSFDPIKGMKYHS